MIHQRHALRMAEAVREDLRPFTVQIAIVGEVRRNLPEVGKISLLAIPRLRPQMFDDGPPFDELEDAIEARKAQGVYTEQDDPEVDNLGVYRLKNASGFPVRIYTLQNANQWGAAMVASTGPLGWLTDFLDDSLLVDEHGLKHPDGTPRDCPTEQTFFEALGKPFVHPQDRRDPC